MVPKILDDGSVRPVKNMVYVLFKIGQKIERHSHNPEHFEDRGEIYSDIKINKGLVVGSLATSRIQSIYIEGLKEYDELFYPLLGIMESLEDLPQTRELDMPPLADGDMVLATLNSIYCLKPIRKDISRSDNNIEVQPLCEKE